GSMMGMPVGALVAGPLAAAIGMSATQYGAAALMLVASGLTLIPREVRKTRATKPVPVPVELVPAEAVSVRVEAVPGWVEAVPVEVVPVSVPVELAGAEPVLATTPGR